MRLLAVLAMGLVAAMASMQAQAQNRYGSIAFSQQPDGGYKWGITWNSRSREGAESQAITGCRGEGGRSCTEIYWFRNTCGALAIGGGNGWGTGAGATAVDAQRGALAKCRTRNRDCQIAVARCAVASTNAVTQSLTYSSRGEQPKLRDRYGSIAFSQQGDGGYQWGFTWDFDSRQAARNRAVAGCRSKGGGAAARSIGSATPAVRSPSAARTAGAQEQGQPRLRRNAGRSRNAEPGTAIAGLRSRDARRRHPKSPPRGGVSARRRSTRPHSSARWRPAMSRS